MCTPRNGRAIELMVAGRGPTRGRLPPALSPAAMFSCTLDVKDGAKLPNSELLALTVQDGARRFCATAGARSVCWFEKDVGGVSSSTSSSSDDDSELKKPFASAAWGGTCGSEVSSARGSSNRSSSRSASIISPSADAEGWETSMTPDQRGARACVRGAACGPCARWGQATRGGGRNWGVGAPRLHRGCRARELTDSSVEGWTSSETSRVFRSNGTTCACTLSFGLILKS